MQKSEIDYFKEILQSRKAQIEENINSVSDEIQQIDFSELSDEGDYASANNETLVEGAIIEQQKKELQEIDVALKKIANGEYGMNNSRTKIVMFLTMVKFIIPTYV